MPSEGGPQPWQWDVVDKILKGETVQFAGGRAAGKTEAMRRLQEFVDAENIVRRRMQVFVVAESYAAFNHLLREAYELNLPNPMEHRYRYLENPVLGLRGLGGEHTTVIMYGSPEILERKFTMRHLEEVIWNLQRIEASGSKVTFVQGSYRSTSNWLDDLTDSMQQAATAFYKFRRAANIPSDDDVCEACHEPVSGVTAAFYDQKHDCWYHAECKAELDSL